METIERERQNNSKALFVKHHLTKYNGEFPIWVIVELFTLGMTSRFYADMITADKKKLAKSLYATASKNLVGAVRHRFAKYMRPLWSAVLPYFYGKPCWFLISPNHRSVGSGDHC